MNVYVWCGYSSAVMFEDIRHIYMNIVYTMWKASCMCCIASDTKTDMTTHMYMFYWTMNMYGTCCTDAEHKSFLNWQIGIIFLNSLFPVDERASHRTRSFYQSVYIRVMQIANAQYVHKCVYDEWVLIMKLFPDGNTNFGCVKDCYSIISYGAG